MKHDINLLMDYVEGSLSESDADNVRQHLSACPDCRMEESDIRIALNALRLPLSAFRSAPPAFRFPPSVPSILPRVRQRLESGKSRVHREPWFAPIIRLAAPLVAAVIVVSMLVTMSPGPEERYADDSFFDDPSSFVMTDLAGQTYDVDLADVLFIDASLAETDIPSGLAHISPYDISVVVEDLTDEELNSLANALDKRNSL